MDARPAAARPALPPSTPLSVTPTLIVASASPPARARPIVHVAGAFSSGGTSGAHSLAGDPRVPEGGYQYVREAHTSRRVARAGLAGSRRGASLRFMSVVGVLTVHHEEDARRSTRAIVNATPGFAEVGAAGSAEEALDIAMTV